VKLKFLGASGTVTGSCYLLTTDSASVMIDFGSFQGGRHLQSLNRTLPVIDFSRLSAVLLTHAHNDHTGRLPLLLKAGFSGSIHATEPSIDLTSLILKDSAKVQAYDMERINRKRERAGQEPYKPLYNAEDVERILSFFKPVIFNHYFQVVKGIAARYIEAGHMLGSASIEVVAEENGQKKRVIFSGDIGPKGVPYLRDPETFETADVVVMESTYGDRDHKPLAATLVEFKGIISKVVERGGKIIVPSFAIGRTQQIIYHLAAFFKEGSFPRFPVYVDGPMALEANRIYARHSEIFDAEAQALLKSHELQDAFASVKTAQTAEQSRAINGISGPCMIIAGAGMCNAGRVLHHLKQNLWKSENAVVIVGFQAEGTLGRLLVDGEPVVKIMNEPIAVKASVHTLSGFSAHAGQTELLQWFQPLANDKPRVFLTHGESRPRAALAREFNNKYGLNPILPVLDQEVEI